MKFGVIGLSSMAKNHACVYSELEHIELVGISDINKSTVKNIVKRFGKKAFAYYKKIFYLSISP